MTTELDITIPAVTLKLINRFGATASLIEPKDEVYDSVEGETTGGTTTLHTTKATPPRHKGRLEDGVMVNRLQTLIAASGLTVEPVAEWVLTLGTSSYKIVGIDPINSGDLTAAYRLWLEG